MNVCETLSKKTLSTNLYDIKNNELIYIPKDWFSSIFSSVLFNIWLKERKKYIKAVKKDIWQTVVFTSFVNGNREKVIFYAEDREKTIPKFATVKKYRVGNRITGLVKA